MTPRRDLRGVTDVATATGMPGGRLAHWNRALNRTHAMATMRARAGWVVRAIEARRRRLLAKRVLAGPHAKVIDLGCEDGWMSEAWAPFVQRLVLVDVDPAPLEAARRRLPGDVRTAVADVTDTTALAGVPEAGQADVVVLSAILEHLPDPGPTVQASLALLRPGGRCVVYVPADRPINGLKAVLAYTRTGGLVRGLSLEPAPGHLHVFDRTALRALLTTYGKVAELSFDPVALGYVAVVRR